jgi:hypothetical protein
MRGIFGILGILIFMAHLREKHRRMTSALEWLKLDVELCESPDGRQPHRQGLGEGRGAATLSPRVGPEVRKVLDVSQEE